MKAQITISGQLNGNLYLKSKILNNGNYTDFREGMFNSYHIEFATIGEAKKAMSGAWKDIKSESENLSWHDGLSKDKEQLTYDSSKANLKHFNQHL